MSPLLHSGQIQGRQQLTSPPLAKPRHFLCHPWTYVRERLLQRGEIERPPHLKNCVGGRAMVLNSTTPLYCPTLTLASNFSIFYKITLKLDLDKLQLIFKSNDFAYPHQVIKIAPIKRKWQI